MSTFWFNDYWFQIFIASSLSGGIGAAIASSQSRSTFGGFIAGFLLPISILSLLPFHFQTVDLDFRIGATSVGKWALTIAFASLGAIYAYRRCESTLVGFIIGAGLGLSAPLIIFAVCVFSWKFFVALTSLLQ